MLLTFKFWLPILAMILTPTAHSAGSGPNGGESDDETPTLATTHDDRLKFTDPNLRRSKASPNVIVIMADDQDMILDSLSVQPNVMKLIAEQGTLFENHYCTVAWCCPSRVNFLTGRAAHNTNVTAIAPPYGGWPKFLDQGLNDNYLPVWINQSGISTYYVGKFMNAYADNNFDDPHPGGWTESTFLVDPWTYNYFHSQWTDGYTDTINAYPGIHTTNVTQDKALHFIDTAAAKGEQFFMMVAPAPHVQIADGLPAGPPAPPEFDGIYADRVVPRTPDFNPDVPSGASWVYHLPKLTDDEVADGDRQYYLRLENLAGIDLMVEALINRLDSHGLLEDTYVIYTSDNGFHISNHRMGPGKRCGYETDINVPLIMRGPGIPKGVNSSTIQSHTDMAPTILNMLGVPLRQEFDGSAIPITNPTETDANEYANVEFWNADETPEQNDGDPQAPGTYYNNTYKSLRMQSSGGSFYYSVWCYGGREFYDMQADYYQMNNLLGPEANTKDVTYFGRPVEQLFSRLDTLLLVLKGCQQDACRNAYGVLFPEGNVTTLEEAMEETYDTFFANQPKVSFANCVSGQIISLEGPQTPNVYHG